MNQKDDELIAWWVHDCPECTFLGPFTDGADGEYELYFCTQNATRPTVIARYGEAPGDYLSGIALADQDPALAEAKRRAIARGLLFSS